MPAAGAPTAGAITLAETIALLENDFEAVLKAVAAADIGAYMNVIRQPMYAISDAGGQQAEKHNGGQRAGPVIQLR